MSASDNIGYFVELGEYNLIIARATLGPKPRTIEAIKEVWLSDAAAADGLINELRPGGAGAKATALLRLKGRTTLLADATQGKNVASPDAVENFLKTTLGAENTPANWAWYGAGTGLVPQGGARWALDAAPSTNTEDVLNKLRGWTFELVRCQSAPLTLAGALSTAAKTNTILLVEVSENNSTLISISSQGVTSLATIPVGMDALAGATQTALGLKFKGSAGRLMFNDSYDFSETAGTIVEPLAAAIKGALGGLGNPAQLACSGILARQTWLHQALAKSLGLAPFAPDVAGWIGGRGLALGSGVNAADIAPSWLGVLNAVSAHELAQPGGVRPWNPILSNTPVAAAPIIPAIIMDPVPAKPATPPPAIIPAILPEPAKPAAPAKPAEPAKPAIIPAIIQEPAKTATPAAPAKPAAPAAPAKPAVIITPPSKPAEPAKPATPPAKPAGAPAKPAEPVKPATPPAKPAEAAKPAVQPKPGAAPAPVAKPTPKPEPAKPSPAAKPAPAPVVSGGAKPATAAPFPPKKNNMPIIIGIAAALVIGVGGFLYISGSNKEKEAAALREKERSETEAKFKALERERAEQARKAEEERKAREIAAHEEAAKRARELEELRKKQEIERNQLLFGRGTFVVATDPIGASVTIDQYGTKTSPVAQKDMRLGPYTATISMPGYDTETRTFEIKDKETTDLGTIVLKRQVGTIELSSEPSNLAYEIKPAGAMFVNPGDLRSGQTPASVTGLPIGSYVVTISRPNWTPYTTTISVEKNGSHRVNGNFPGGSVVINSNIPGADVLRDNQVKIGVTPLTLNGIPPGNLSFTVNYRGCDPVTLTGKLEGGKTLTLNATLFDSDRVMKLSELDERPAPIFNADLDPSATTQGGTALISMIVGKDGIPTDLKIEQASSPTFGKACMAAAAKWRFKPGSVRGKPARSRVTIPFKITTE